MLPNLIISNIFQKKFFVPLLPLSRKVHPKTIFGTEKKKSTVFNLEIWNFVHSRIKSFPNQKNIYKNLKRFWPSISKHTVRIPLWKNWWSSWSGWYQGFRGGSEKFLYCLWHSSKRHLPPPFGLELISLTVYDWSTCPMSWFPFHFSQAHQKS